MARTAPSARTARPVPEEHHTETQDGFRAWLPDRADAWIGFLRTHSQLLKALDADLAARHGINLSAFEVLTRSARGGDAGVRITTLAEQAMLSQSRVSRLVDQLVARGLVTREPCATDSRVVHVVVTPAGLALLREAEATHFDGVEDRFFGRLSCTEISQLARIFSKLSTLDDTCDVHIAETS